MREWSDIIQDVTYQALTPEEKKKIKSDYWNEISAPELKKSKVSPVSIESQKNNFFGSTTVLVPDTKIKPQSMPAPMPMQTTGTMQRVERQPVSAPPPEAPKAPPKKETPLVSSEEEYKAWVEKEKPSVWEKIKTAWKSTTWSGAPRKVLDRELKKVKEWKERVKIVESLKKKYPSPAAKLIHKVFPIQQRIEVNIERAKKGYEDVTERYTALIDPKDQNRLIKMYGKEGLEKEKQRMLKLIPFVEEKIKTGARKQGIIEGAILSLGLGLLVKAGKPPKLNKNQVDDIFKKIRVDPKFSKKAYSKIKETYGPKDADIIIKAVNKRLKTEAMVIEPPAPIAPPIVIKPRLKISQTPEIQKVSAVKTMQLLKKAPKIITPQPTTEEQLMKNIILKLQSKKVQLTEIKKDFIKYAQEYLPLHERGRLLSQVRIVNTRAGLAKARTKIDAVKLRIGRKIAIDDLKTTIKRLDVKKLRPEYRIPIQSLVNVDLIRHSKKTIGGLESMKAYIEAHPDNNIPQTELEKLLLLSTKKIGDMTVENIELIKNSISHLTKLHDLKNKIIFGRKLVDSHKVITKARENLTLRKRKTAPEEKEIVIAPKKVKEAGFAKKFMTTMAWKPELITQKLDFSESGIIREIVYNQIRKGMNTKLAIKHEAEDYFRDKIKFNIDSWSDQFSGKTDVQKIELPSGKTIKLTKEERVALYLHSVSGGKNLKHRLRGGFVFDKNVFAEKTRIDIDDMEKIVSTMTKKELYVAKVLSDYYNIYQKNQINNVALKMNGYTIADVPNYYPVNIIPIDIKKDYTKIQKNFSQATLEGMGMLKEQVGGKSGLILRGAFTDLFNTVEKISAYTGLAEPLRNAKMLLYDKKFQQDVVNTPGYGKDYLQTLQGYLKKTEDSSHDLTELTKATTALMNKIDIAILGMNLWVILKQPISYIGAATEIKMR